MLFIPKQLIFLVCLILFSPSIVSGESNFDFFFKTPTQYQNVTVKEVLSADTITLQEKIGEKAETIKLIGLRAPAAPKRKTVDIDRDQYGFVRKEEVSPLTSIEEQAFEFVQELLEGQRVRIEFDVEKNGESNTTLAYVFLIEDSTFVNTEILRHGFAHLHIRPPNTKYTSKLREAYKEARTEKRGLQGQ